MHCDIKTANVLVNRQQKPDGSYEIALADFGLSCEVRIILKK